MENSFDGWVAAHIHPKLNQHGHFGDSCEHPLVASNLPALAPEVRLGQRCRAITFRKDFSPERHRANSMSALFRTSSDGCRPRSWLNHARFLVFLLVQLAPPPRRSGGFGSLGSALPFGARPNWLLPAVMTVLLRNSSEHTRQTKPRKRKQLTAAITVTQELTKLNPSMGMRSLPRPALTPRLLRGSRSSARGTCVG